MGLRRRWKMIAVCSTAAVIGLCASLAGAPSAGEDDPTGAGATAVTVTEIGPGGTTISVSQR